jgi:CDP-diacylglycerol--serine O-phosphatidyltransferase
MVSNLKYYSFKTINLRKSVPFITVLTAAVAVGLTALQPPLVLFAGFVVYAISGYVVSSWQYIRRSRSGAAR